MNYSPVKSADEQQAFSSQLSDLSKSVQEGDTFALRTAQQSVTNSLFKPLKAES
jgi:hypothetical protein